MSAAAPGREPRERTVKSPCLTNRDAVLLGLTSLVLLACGRGDDQRATQLASAGASPAIVFRIGPQPGPDRVLPVLQNPYAGDRAVLLEGRRLFNWYNCSGCHGDHGGGGMGPSLRDSLWYYGGDDSSIFASVSEGRDKGMPAWGVKLPRDQIWKLVSYIRSMRTPDEPEQPR
jgi:cytochrome c oxidase cbb3-type subunit 3